MIGKQVIHALAPLPGGNGHYLSTLHEMLSWLKQHPGSSRGAFVKWVISQYGTSLASVNNYYQTLLKLGVIHRTRSGPIRLTSLGIAALEAIGENKAILILDQLATSYSAFLDTLAILVEHNGLLTLDEIINRLQDGFPQWQSISQYQERVHWLLSLGCVEKIEGRRAYQVTAFGRAFYRRCTNPNPESGTHSEANEEAKLNTVSDLIRRMEEAALDSTRSHLFEDVLADVFQFLGFQVKKFGKTGNTDILVTALLGPESFSAVVDAKSRKDGRLQILEAYTLQEHREKHNAQYSVVVAQEFSLGKVIRQAEAANVTLMTVQFVRSWIELHAVSPLNVQYYRALFMESGLVKEFPSSVVIAVERHKRARELIITIIDFVQEVYKRNVNLAWSADQLYANLAVQLQSIRYTQPEVEEAIAFLAHPTIQAVILDSQGAIILGMDRSMLGNALHSLATRINGTEF
jgi:hypothetical protein